MPEQYALLPISEKFVDFCKQVQDDLATHDIRGFIDDRNETIGRKIRDTELKKIPYMLIVGEKEMEAGGVAVRRQGEGDQGTMLLADFVTYFKADLNKED
jgi:threonyl-tRNA synthetase